MVSVETCVDKIKHFTARIFFCHLWSRNIMFQFQCNLHKAIKNHCIIISTCISIFPIHFITLYNQLFGMAQVNHILDFHNHCLLTSAFLSTFCSFWPKTSSGLNSTPPKFLRMACFSWCHEGGFWFFKANPNTILIRLKWNVNVIFPHNYSFSTYSMRKKMLISSRIPGTI